MPELANIQEYKTSTTPLATGLLIHRAGGTVRPMRLKSSGWVEGYLVSWGNEKDTDLQGEHFTPRTEFCLDWFDGRPVLYHHGLDGEAGLRKIGTIKSVEQDDLGLWVQAQLELRDRYANAVYDMVKASEFGWSSGSVDHLVKIATNGEIAVWPLIEGSITPTPAQPSKTTVRAFKAMLQSDPTLANYLRGLDARVMVTTKNGVADVRLLDKEEGRKFYVPNGTSVETSTSRRSAKRLAQEYARRFGIRTTDQELNAVAADVEMVVEDEISQAAADELETDAALAALEQEMIGTEDNIMARSLRTTQQNSRKRSTRGYAYRDGDAPIQSDELAATMEDELAAQMDDIASAMADEIAAEMEEEVAQQAEEAAMEKSFARAIRRRAYQRAMRGLEPTDSTEATIVDAAGIEDGGTGEVDPSYLGEFAMDDPIPNMKRYGRRQPAQPARRPVARRGYAYRDDIIAVEPVAPQAVLADTGEELALQTEENAMMMEEVARRAFQNGFRRGVRKAFRATDGIGDSGAPIIEEDNSEPGNVDQIAAGGADITTATASYRNGSRRQAAQRRPVARRGYAYREDDALLADEDAIASDDDAVAAEEDAVAAFQKGFRTALRQARQTPARRGYGRKQDVFEGEEMPVQADPYMTDEAIFNDPTAVMDDETALMADEALMAEETAYGVPARSFNRTARRAPASRVKSFDDTVDYWRRRAIKAETMEAPGQRSFNNMQVTDSADRHGAYNGAFKSYLYRGMDVMSESEKYTLINKGKTDWKDARGSFGFDRNGAIKTYFGGSDASVGFAVPPDWVAELNKNIMTQTVMAPECRTRTTTSDRIVQPNLLTTDARRAHAATTKWPGEQITQGTVSRTTEDTFTQVSVPINVMLISLTAGNSALEDVTFSLEDEINEAFSEAVAVAYDELIWSGDGVGKLEGIVVNNQVVGARSTGMQSVSGYIPTGSVDGILTADTLKEMLFHLPRPYRQRAKWYMNSNTGLQVATLKDGNGNYLIDQRDESLQAVGVPEKLLGRPIVYNEYADDVAEDSIPVVLGDLSRGYLIGKRVDFSIRRFDDSNFAQLDQVLFLGRARLGGQVLQPAALKVMKVSAS